MNNKADNRLLIALLAFILIILIILSVILYFILSYPPQEQRFESWNETILGPIVINETVVFYILDQVNADSLHKSMLSNSAPELEISIDNEVFYAQIINNKIIVKKGYSENEDIRIYIPQNHIVEILKSNNPKEAIRSSFMSGASSFSPIAGETELVAKGYLGIYNYFK